MQRILYAQSESARRQDSSGEESGIPTDYDKCKKEPVFYNIRRSGATIDEIQGNKIDIPGYKKQFQVPAGSIVASIDRIEAGYVNGWVCVCEGDHESFDALVAIDGTAVAFFDIKERFESPPIDILQICDEKGEQEQQGHVEGIVLGFNISFPPVPIGMHEMQVFVDARNSKINSWIEVYHSPARFEESTIEPSDKAIISRKDEIITQRNIQLSKIWNAISTELPWKKSERDAEDISLFFEEPTEYAAVILVQSEPQNQKTRYAVRSSWGHAAPRSNMVVRFLIENTFSGIFEGMIVKEAESSSDIILIETEAGKSKHAHRVLKGLSRAVKDVSAAFYFLSLDKIIIFPDRLSSLLDSLRDRGDIYMGSMKSGPVVRDSSSRWFEEKHWRFGDAKGENNDPQYPRHARGHFYGFSAPVARFLARNKEVLHAYSNEDVTVGTWMLGLNVDYVDEGLLNCDIKSCGSQDYRSRGSKCAVFSESPCKGLCSDEAMIDMFTKCASS